MYNQVQSQYQQSEILDAPPMRLVVLLYRGAIDAVVRARQHLAAGEIRERSNQIMRAYEMIGELGTSLDTAQGGELAKNLLRLYDYMQHQLLQANIKQAAEPLDDVEVLLRNLLGSWEQIASQPQAAPAAKPAQAERRPLVLSA